MRFILKVLLGAVAISIACGSLPTLASATSQQDCEKAENQLIRGANPKNWKSLYVLFKRFGDCEDGAIGEGFSEDVAQLLSKQWTHLDTLNHLTTADKAFERFVLRHIDATLSEEELKVILENSTLHCPAGEKRLCSLVRARTSESLDELRKGSKVNLSRLSESGGIAPCGKIPHSEKTTSQELTPGTICGCEFRWNVPGATCSGRIIQR